ncbi:MAG: hypothetical protein ACXWFU_02510 [Actinomycetota bacterium]
MKTSRRLLAAFAVAAVSVMYAAGVAQAQVRVEPTATPVRNDGGWVFQAAQLLALLGIVTVVMIVIGYMRFAPRFAKDEESIKVVRADRVVVGQELPRRNVDLSQAVPVVVAPPAVPVPAGAVAGPAAVPAAVPAAAAAPAIAPAAVEAAPAAAPERAAAPPAAPAERVEVSMDQAVFDSTLEELLAAGTDRRIAEGKARRAAMIAAKKKAAGES